MRPIRQHRYQAEVQELAQELARLVQSDSQSEARSSTRMPSVRAQPLTWDGQRLAEPNLQAQMAGDLLAEAATLWPQLAE